MVVGELMKSMECVAEAVIDEWSVGCIILEMLVGSNPLESSQDEQDLRNTCDCKKKLHINYSGGQLFRIFSVLGTPTDDIFLSNMACLEHFQHWPRYRPRLAECILERCDISRFDPAVAGSASSGAAVDGTGGAADEEDSAVAAAEAAIAERRRHEFNEWMTVGAARSADSRVFTGFRGQGVVADGWQVMAVCHPNPAC